MIDIVISGGGLSGVAAAIAAARMGSDVLLIERYGFVGGMATAGLVNPFMPYWEWKPNYICDMQKQVNAGIYEEILQELMKVGGLHNDRQVFDEEFLKLVLDRMLSKYGVKRLYHTIVIDVLTENNHIKAIEIANKSGKSKIEAKYFIDTTGDADVAYRAGCEYRSGREEDGKCQPMTLCCRIANVDKALLDMNEVNEKYKAAKERGEIKNPREDILVFSHMAENILHFNSTRILNRSAVDAQDLTEAEAEGREQVNELFNFLKNNFKAFANSIMVMTAPQIGIRETRRIVGDYTITGDDILNAAKFEDSIARGTYPLDMHSPTGEGGVMKFIPNHEYYTIPYRALIPKGIDNLIVAGRPISSTHEAHSAYRVMPICTCIGEGAGVAAGIAVKENCSFRQVNVKEIQEVLSQNNALY